MQAGYRDTLASLVDLARLGLFVPPMVTCASIEKDGDEEEVNEAAGQLLFIAALVLPLLDEVGDPWYITDLEMLPTAVRRDRVEPIGTKVALASICQIAQDVFRGSWKPTLMTEATKSTTSSSLSSRRSK